MKCDGPTEGITLGAIVAILIGLGMATCNVGCSSMPIQAGTRNSSVHIHGGTNHITITPSGGSEIAVPVP